jgi:predicted ATPase
MEDPVRALITLAARQLWGAAELGFLTPMGGVRGVEEAMLAGDSSGFRFVHDRVQEASYSLLPTSERPTLHLTLARQLRTQLEGPSSPELLFDVVGHFARSSDGAIGFDEQMAVAALELRAAEQATDSGAHDTALTLLERALARYGEDVWTADYAGTCPSGP